MIFYTLKATHPAGRTVTRNRINITHLLAMVRILMQDGYTIVLGQNE